MYPVSAAFLATVRTSHTRTSRAVLRDPSGNGLLTLNPNGGGVTVDSRRDVRRTCTDLTLVNAPGDDLIPATGTDDLSPLTDNEVALYRGVIIPATGLLEEVPLGVFGFEAAQIAESRDGLTITLTGLADRSRIVTRSRWRAPYAIPAGSDLTAAISTALTYCWPGNPGLTSFVSITTSVQAVFTEGGDSDPWKDLCGVAAAYGCELFMDATGTPTLRYVPTPLSSEVVATYQDGADAVLLGVTRSVSIAEGSYNGIIVTGESSGGSIPVRAEWWDNDDPTIPPARPRPAFFTSSLIVNKSQALSTAQLLLPKYLGATELVSWSQVPNPALDAWDVVHVARSTVKVSTDVVLDNFTIPLKAEDPMPVLGRGKTVWS